jgi:hypothetical protein
VYRTPGPAAPHRPPSSRVRSRGTARGRVAAVAGRPWLVVASAAVAGFVVTAAAAVAVPAPSMSAPAARAAAPGAGHAHQDLSAAGASTSAAAPASPQDASDERGTGTSGKDRSGSSGAARTRTSGQDASDEPAAGGHSGVHASSGQAATAAAAGHHGTRAKPAPGRWVPVNRASWRRQLAAFRALRAEPFPPTSRRISEFNATCRFSHARADDPIVFPGRPGASHMHSFFGNRRTDASTTTRKLMKFTASSCVPAQDHSAYWIPTLYERGRPVQPREMTVYYGSVLQDDEKPKTVPIPKGLRMLIGDPGRQVPTPREASGQFWCAGRGPAEGVARSRDGNWPICEDGATLTFMLRFPDCWDGKHLDSPDHRSHVGWAHLGRCTREFPVPIPTVTFAIGYPTGGSPDGFRLSSGMASSMHGDAFFAWEPAAMAQRVRNCVVQVVACNSEGGF